MKVSEVSNIDGQMAAALAQNMAVAEKLFDALKLAGMPVTGPGMDKRAEAAKWLGGLLQQMAQNIHTTNKLVADNKPMRVKSVGSMGGTSTPSRKKSKK